MSEENTSLLIGTLYGLGLIFLFYYFMSDRSSNKREQTVATQNSITPTQKSIWDKLKIVSIVISSIAALIYAIVKLIEIFKT